MAQHTSSLHRALRTGFFHLLLVGIASLPDFAFAVDSDGDGVDNTIDAFPNNKEASVDTDGDGMPNSIVIANMPVFENFEAPLAGWTLTPSGSVGRTDTSSGRKVHTGSYAGGWTATGSGFGNFTKTTSAGTVSFWQYSSLSSPKVQLTVDGVQQTLSCATNGWNQCVAKLSPGTHTLTLQIPAPGVFCSFGCISASWFIDDIAVSTLAEDSDDDNDGVTDGADQCPLDAACTLDADGDGIDNAVDPDDDNDTVVDGNDNCPLNINADQLNTDGDANGNICDSDDDNDSVADASDKFPLNIAASSDADVDGFPGSWNVACDATCQANSGLVLDNCPSNANADQLNTDGDSQGNVCDSDDDNDGVVDSADAFPLDNTQAGDIDADGIDGFVDNCPANANADQADTDGDTLPDACTDTDDDNDGVADTSDKFPLNVAASSDTDVDGFPGSWNAACDAACQANSGLLLDNCPSNVNTDQLNTDGDTQGNACDTDDDNDSVVDTSDTYPLDPTESVDTDGDATGNNADLDDDNDGLQDQLDNCPITANPGQQDGDSDGAGDVCDLLITVSLIAAGDRHACVLTTVGGVKCWGDNYFGQLGDNTTTSRYTPVNVVGLGSGIAAIAAGYRHNCALSSAGAVKCWGDNGYGKLGDNTATNRYAPVDVAGLGGGVAAITAGDSHTCALMTNGGVKCWGFNGSGQLGDNTAATRNAPVDVTGLNSGVMAIAAGGNHTCALTTNGAVKCWGNNGSGQVGDNTTVEKYTPTNVVGLESGIVTIETGLNSSTCALTVGNGMKCWGLNANGQLGDNTTVRKLTAVDVSGLVSGVASMALGAEHTCALTTVGGVKCWGYNGSGELGDNTTVRKLTAVDVSGLGEGVAAIAAGSSHTCALTTDGGVKCWGSNTNGQLGDNTFSLRTAPVWVIGFGDPDGDGLMDFNDNCPSNANADQLNTDGDALGNVCDSDDDNDGVVDTSDAFPLNAAETLDTDLDGTGNNVDLDDDNDGLPDAMDPLPLQAKFNRDANYQGSQVRDSNGVQ